MFNNFANSRYVQGPKEFLDGNSLISKLAFLVFVLIVFVVLLRLGGQVLSWLFSPSSDPHLLDGMIDAKHLVVYPQDPSIKGSVPILRSNNQEDGLEFTWSVWMFIEDLEYKKDEYKHVFHKGTMDSLLQQSSADNTGNTVPGMSFPNNAPGLYIAPNTNDLVVVMNTFENPNETIIVPDIPINKWVNVIIRCDNTTLDVYINGTIIKRHQLSGVPRQNYDDVYAAANGGFSGYISNLWYYNYALGTSAVEGIVENGPNLKMKDTNMIQSEPYYLSLRWFFTGTGDQYFPTTYDDAGMQRMDASKPADFGLPQ
jgi:hypothetical protein